MLIQREWALLLGLSLLTACGEPGKSGKGRIDVGSVVAPLYGGVQVSYKAVADGDGCGGKSEGQVLGPASRGEGPSWTVIIDWATESLNLPAGKYGICATVLDASGQPEPRCPTAATRVEVVEGSSASVHIAVVCDPVIDEAGGHAYTVTPFVDNYIEAKRAAEDMGGHLVFIDSRAENLMLSNYFSPRKWIGMWDENADGSFQWLDGKPRDYTNFCIGEPNFIRGEQYIEWGFGGADREFCWNNEVLGPRQGIVEFE